RRPDSIRAYVQLRPSGARYYTYLFTIRQQTRVTPLDEDQAVGVGHGEAQRRSFGQVQEPIDDALARVNQKLSHLAAQQPLEAAFNWPRQQTGLNAELSRTQP